MDLILGSNPSEQDVDQMRLTMAELGVNESDLAKFRDRVNQSQVLGGATGVEACANLDCNKHGTNKCARCKRAFYCSKECQRLDWKARHKKSCGKTETSSIINPLEMLRNLEAGKSGGWYSGLLTDHRKRVYERLYMSFQLRVEDEYTFGGNMVGTYGVQADDGDPETTSQQFRKFYGLFKSKSFLPPDWTDSDNKKLMKAAEKNIHYALEKSDVVEKFGYASQEHVVLRSMAEQVLGPIGSWPI